MLSLLANRRLLVALLVLALALVLIAFWWAQRSDPNAAYIAVLGTAQATSARRVNHGVIPLDQTRKGLRVTVPNK